jgi:hypothetical protein
MLRTLMLILLLTSSAAAHEPGIGPNGGMRVDAGPYRVELVPEGTVVNAHITMDDDSQVDTSTMSGTAILLIDGKPVRSKLAPSSPGILSGDAGVTLSKTVTGAVQITGSDGKTVQAKF